MPAHRSGYEVRTPPFGSGAAMADSDVLISLAEELMIRPAVAARDYAADLDLF